MIYCVIINVVTKEINLKTYKLYNVRSTLLVDKYTYFRGVSRLYYTPPYDMSVVQFRCDHYLSGIPSIERDKMAKYKVVTNESSY